MSPRCVSPPSPRFVEMRVRLTVMAGPIFRSCIESRTPERRSAVGWDTFSHFMRIGVPRENTSGEHRVALVPEVVSKLKAKGLDVVIQSGAGADALLSDAAFTDAGAQVTDDAAEVWKSDVVVTIAPPDPQALRCLGAGSILM